MNNKNLMLWKHVASLYPEGVAELIAVDNVLLLCVSGFSNKTIAERYSLDEVYVKNVCKEHLDIEGWETDLGFSPWYAYKGVRGNTHKFENLLNILSKTTLNGEVGTYYSACEKFLEIRKELDKYYVK